MTTTYPLHERLSQLNTTVVIDHVVYTPNLIHLGSGQGDWQPVPYAQSRRHVMKISIDDIQNNKTSFCDNVFRRIGLHQDEESINIQPLVLEMVESSFSDFALQDLVPMVLTQMNAIFDQINAASLQSSAKPGDAITWTCPPSFINTIVQHVTDHPYDMVKHVIIPQKVFTALNTITHHLECRHWANELQSRLNNLNATLRSSSFVGDSVFIIQEPLLAEYTGAIPQVLREGFDQRSNEYWIQFLLSTSDFKPRISEAIQSYAVNSLDLSKVCESACPKNS